MHISLFVNILFPKTLGELPGKNAHKI